MQALAVNISTIYQEYPFLARFKKAQQAGFSSIECQFPYEYPVESIQHELSVYDLTLELINLPPGDWDKGERGIAIFPDRVAEFKQSVELGIQYATCFGTSKIHCMAGVLSENLDREFARDTFIENIRFAAKELAKYHITVVIEPINSGDMPGYFLADVDEAVAIIYEIGLPNVKLQFDFYHIQRIHGNVLSYFKRYLDRVSHIQIADWPGRHQPGTGEMDYKQIFETIEKIGYKGVIGLEYFPNGKSDESFDWLTF
ncbi:hydroxypyruvate isomerase family protein [Bacillus sp. Marseille-P3661]|uniref:hydroxypyruvate isomerase family protein n=1 Tax=Bacillus sp. Marseille-P3661 TaxID=1936234 RepID=UPI000C833205|nr:TIM barrel protein [Bacillus sp. Marseille-P3661]